MTLRPPPHVAELLRQIAEAEDRTLTAVLTRALRLYAKENGYTWPKAPPGEPAE